MPANIDNKLIVRLNKLSKTLRMEQRRLLEEAANYDEVPNKNILKQIAELELNIVAIENNLAELEA